MRFEQQWLGRRYAQSDAENYPLFPVEVPGNIQYDYAKFIGIKDLQFASNVKMLEETEDFFWEYRCQLAYDAPKDGEKLYLVAEGVDYQFDILLDGKKIHAQEGMYTPVELDISALAHPGALLQFILYPHPKRPGPYVSYRDLADQSCKPPVVYGWDWNPRLLISGLWLPCYLETRDQDFIRSCEPFYTLNDARDTAFVRFETDCDADVSYTLLDQDGTIVYQGTNPEFELNNIHLWWCNGQGEAYLYTWIAENKTHKRQGKIGFRTVRLIQNADANEKNIFPKPRYPAFMTIELNGRPIFAKGSNWVNPELFFGRITRARYEELLLAAKDANMNILRLWGGAGFNKPAFYEICDELGLMVWQEFMLACNNYRGTPHYLSTLEKEASSAVRALRHHPSIVLWCGGNELFNSWSGMDEQSHALRLLNKLCYELDFERPFLMTSPSAGMAHGGYLFQDEATKEDVFSSFARSEYTAYTEFGVPCFADLESLKKIIPENELYPITPTESWVTHHAFHAWGETRWACLPILEYFFGKIDSLEKMVSASQWLQYAGYKAIFEEARRQWPHCSMAINWCYEEPWLTAANNSLISYPMKLKPGYFAVKESLRSVIASARIPHFAWKSGDVFSAEIWLLNDSPDAASETISVFLKIGNWEKELLTWKCDPLPGGKNLLGPSIHCVLPEIEESDTLELILKTGNPERDNHYRLHYSLRNVKKPTGQLNV